jgi:hypothetical protein
VGRDGAVALKERRSVGWVAIDARTWRLSFASVLRTERRATLNSPGSKGRPGGGYGGFFWRFPACEGVEVFTASEQGEDEVHGTVSPWVAWSADFLAGPGVSGPATLVFVSPDAAAARDPWFVRVRDYPGLGSALAWDRPLVLEPGGVVHRRFDVGVAAGRLSEEQAAALAAELGAARSS